MMVAQEEEELTVTPSSEHNDITIKLSEVQQKLIWRLREQITN